MIWEMCDMGDVCKLYANTMTFYIGDLLFRVAQLWILLSTVDPEPTYQEC